MRALYFRHRETITSTVKAVAEGLWNGIVVSGVLIISAMLIKSVSVF